MDTVKLLWSIFKKSHADRLMGGFLICFVICAAIFWLFDPGVDNPANGLWLAFNIASSIGLGDYTVTTPIARAAAILLGVYGVVIVAFIPGLIASYYAQSLQTQKEQVVRRHGQALSKIDEMSHEDLKALSDKIRRSRS